MIHKLLAGHFDVGAVTNSGLRSVTHEIDMDVVSGMIDEAGLDRDGQSFLIGGDRATCADGYVEFPWLKTGVNHDSVAFMLELNKKTGCVFVDSGSGEVVDTAVLLESIGK